ncbi:glycosyltransferase family 4 protein [Cellulomonas dongxiuzhuiae]|uniref:Glycosyltransferase family 4 protein n=1 Tax=Cellulomonas dongxiuzhuiae TaxID=2819979 RepID=A0ABX8GN45_9CELL|nr:glycosyltransferase family 4 protein [Cellulomonas dongxiuzhuiae]MBO3093339.1 glycosyltransferase family 4 protein [Cellulomonas dongxiuzhuiae]QWC17618.1 glycosyltransferase family 4 protein [Cellulomonas dongxiuzhuiae]
MRILAWHVHGSWMTSFVQGAHEYLVPVDAERSPDGLGRARTWDWPVCVREVPLAGLRDERFDVVLLQRPRDLELLERWAGLRAGVDVPAVYVEHNTPVEHPVGTRHLLAGRDDVLLVHVTAFNALVWDNGRAPVTVVEHGVPDPGHLWTGERARVAAVVNEPVRRWRVAGTDVLLRVADAVPVEVYGMGMAALAGHLPAHAAHLHDDVPQARMHQQLAGARAYLHPYRWTSLGLSLVEAMTLGMPVLALATTAAPEAVPADAGVVSSDPSDLVAAARRWLADPAEAKERGLAAREHALRRFGLERFLSDWHEVIEGVTR